MSMKHKHQSSGQALVTVIFGAVIALTVVTGSITALINDVEGNTAQEMGAKALMAAESGVESALIGLLRNPGYVGEAIQFDSRTSATVTVSTASGVIISSRGTSGPVTRRVSVTSHYNGINLVIDSWKEIP